MTTIFRVQDSIRMCVDICHPSNIWLAKWIIKGAFFTLRKLEWHGERSLFICVLFIFNSARKPSKYFWEKGDKFSRIIDGNRSTNLTEQGVTMFFILRLSNPRAIPSFIKITNNNPWSHIFVVFHTNRQTLGMPSAMVNPFKIHLK